VESKFLWGAIGEPVYDKFVIQEKIKMLQTRRENATEEKQVEYDKKIKAAPSIKVKRIKADACVFCGKSGTIPAKDVVSSSFTNFDLMQNLTSNTICDYCACCMKNSKFRFSNWIAYNSKVQYFGRNEIGKILFFKHELPFAVYVTTSFKKLGHLKAVLNFSANNYEVQFEETKVFFQQEIMTKPWEIMGELYSIPKEEEEKKQAKSFFTKAEIRTGNYSYSRVIDYGRKKWQEKEKVLREYRGNPAFELLVYALNQEKLGINKEREKNGKRKSKSTAKRRGKADDGKRLNLSDLEVDSVGQCKWF